MLISVSKAIGANPWQQTHFVSEAFSIRAILTKCWSPIVWKDGTRLRENFLSCQMMALDFDDGKMGIKDAEAWVKTNGYGALIFTTKSHQKQKGDLAPCDRFRLLLRFAETIADLNTYEHNMKLIMGRLPCDKSCKDGARYFSPSPALISNFQGGRVAVYPYKKPEYKSTPYQRTLKQSGILPRWATNLITCGAQEGERNKQTFKLAICLYAYGMDEPNIIRTILSSAIDLPEKEKLNAAQSGIRRAKRDNARTR